MLSATSDLAKANILQLTADSHYISDNSYHRSNNPNMLKSLPLENLESFQMFHRSQNDKADLVPSPISDEIKLLTNNSNYDNIVLNKLLQEHHLMEKNNLHAYAMSRSESTAMFDKKIDDPNMQMHDIFQNKIVNHENVFRDEKNLINQLLHSFTPVKMSSPKLHFFSRKVFVGGLPPDCDEEEIAKCFRQFGPLIVDWPHKADSKSQFPPKGYCFLLFQDEISVKTLIESCVIEDGKYFWCVTSSSFKEKPVQIRPWNLSDADYVMNAAEPLDLRKTIFVGGVPRPLRAVELAFTMDKLYGGVCYAGIDTDPELKYPKGAGRVSFSNQKSYIAAISARFVQLQFGDIDKKVEVKPYVLDDQLCDECQGVRSNGLPAPYFCANVTCLQYYCEACWAIIHSKPGRQYHKPLVKEGAERTRASIFF